MISLVGDASLYLCTYFDMSRRGACILVGLLIFCKPHLFTNYLLHSYPQPPEFLARPSFKHVMAWLSIYLNPQTPSLSSCAQTHHHIKHNQHHIEQNHWWLLHSYIQLDRLRLRLSWCFFTLHLKARPKGIRFLAGDRARPLKATRRVSSGHSQPEPSLPAFLPIVYGQ